MLCWAISTVFMNTEIILLTTTGDFHQLPRGGVRLSLEESMPKEGNLRKSGVFFRESVTEQIPLGSRRYKTDR